MLSYVLCHQHKFSSGSTARMVEEWVSPMFTEMDCVIDEDELQILHPVQGFIDFSLGSAARHQLKIHPRSAQDTLTASRYFLVGGRQR